MLLAQRLLAIKDGMDRVEKEVCHVSLAVGYHCLGVHYYLFGLKFLSFRGKTSKF